MPLKKLGRYDLIRVLGKGAMGLVYEARDPNLDRRVAIKTIRVENLSAEEAADYEVRFRTEARSAARLQHPNIVSVYDSGRDQDIAYLVMEFVEGEDLKHHLDIGQVYTLEQTLGLMTGLLSALDYAHRLNVVHRDIKPANLLLQSDGHVKLTDFGVARIQDSAESTRTRGTMVGTLKYMSPEQVQGLRIDSRADLFSAGIVLHQLLTGKRAFDGDTDFAVIQQIIRNQPAAPSYFNPQLPQALDAVVAKALAKSPDERFSTAHEFSVALQRVVEQASDRTLVPPAIAAASGPSGTWSVTLRAGESLLSTQPGAAAVVQEIELLYWKDITDCNDPEAFRLFLDKFPGGIYADLARRRVRKLEGGVTDVTEPRGAVPAQSPEGTAMPAAPDITLDSLQQPAGGNAAAVAAGADAAGALNATAANPAAAKEWPDTRQELPPVPAAKQRAAPGSAARPGVFVAEGKGKSRAEGSHETRYGTQSRITAVGDRDRSTVKKSPRRALGLTLAASALIAGAAALALLPQSPAPPAQPEPMLAALGTGAATGLAKPPAGRAVAQASAPGTASPVPVIQAFPTSAGAGNGAASALLPASATASHALPAASAASAVRARRAALEKAMRLKKKPVSIEAAAVSGTASLATQAEAPPRGTPQAAAATERPGVSSKAARGPRQACEDRMLLSFQICMAEQCARPAFYQHPVCAERRALEQRRNDEQMHP